MITLLFYEAAFPTIELSRVLRNRQAGETSDGLEQSFISQGGSLIPNYESNVRTFLKGGGGSVGLAQLRFDCYLHDSGRTVCGGGTPEHSRRLHAVPQWFVSSVSSYQGRGVHEKGHNSAR